MDFVPADSKTLFRFARPPLSLTLPMIEGPFLNVIVPVGVPPYCGITVAVKVTDNPTLAGFTEETRVVMLVAWCTAWFRAREVLASNFVSPE